MRFFQKNAIFLLERKKKNHNSAGSGGRRKKEEKPQPRRRWRKKNCKRKKKNHNHKEEEEPQQGRNTNHQENEGDHEENEEDHDVGIQSVPGSLAEAVPRLVVTPDGIGARERLKRLVSSTTARDAGRIRNTSGTSLYRLIVTCVM